MQVEITKNNKKGRGLHYKKIYWCEIIVSIQVSVLGKFTALQTLLENFLSDYFFGGSWSCWKPCSYYSSIVINMQQPFQRELCFDQSNFLLESHDVICWYTGLESGSKKCGKWNVYPLLVNYRTSQSNNTERKRVPQAQFFIFIFTN